MANRLDGKIAIVTGAGSGMGKAVALGYLTVDRVPEHVGVEEFSFIQHWLEDHEDAARFSCELRNALLCNGWWKDGIS